MRAPVVRGIAIDLIHLMTIQPLYIIKYGRVVIHVVDDIVAGKRRIPLLIHSRKLVDGLLNESILRSIARQELLNALIDIRRT